jgi:hypothetical protein
MREHESAVKRQRRMKTLLKHFAGKAARGLEGKWKEGEALDPSLEAALARELSEGKACKQHKYCLHVPEFEITGNSDFTDIST